MTAQRPCPVQPCCPPSTPISMYALMPLPLESDGAHRTEEARDVLGLTARLDLVLRDPLEELVERRTQLQAGQVRPDAAVDADAERRVKHGLAGDVDLLRVVDDARVTRRAGVDHHHEV